MTKRKPKKKPRTSGEKQPKQKSKPAPKEEEREFSLPGGQGVQLGFIALAGAAVYLFVSSAQDGEARAACTAVCAIRPNYANTNRTLPSFTLPSLNGEKVDITRFRGKALVMNFWTKNCAPCLKEMPALAQFARILKRERKIEFITVTTDSDPNDVRQTLASVLGPGPVPFRVLIDKEGKIINEKFGTRLFPETWFVDPKGVIRMRVDGARDWTSPLALEVSRMITHPSGCGLTFRDGRPIGKHRAICGDIGVISQ